MNEIKLIPFTSLRPSVEYKHQQTKHHWFRLWLIAWSVPSQYLNQCWNIVNSNLRNKLQWNLNRNVTIFVHKNAFEIVIWEMVSFEGSKVYLKVYLSVPDCMHIGPRFNDIRLYFQGDSIHCLSTLRLRQNGSHFTNNIFKCIFLMKNIYILTKISFKFPLKGLIQNDPALVQIMAWHWTGDKALSHHMKINTCINQTWSVNIVMKACWNK